LYVTVSLTLNAFVTTIVTIYYPTKRDKPCWIRNRAKCCH